MNFIILLTSICIWIQFLPQSCSMVAAGKLFFPASILIFVQCESENGILVHTCFFHVIVSKLLSFLCTNLVFSRIRLKQNKYPVMFLTQGVTEKYPMYNDPICQTIPMAIHFAVSANILVGAFSAIPWYFYSSWGWMTEILNLIICLGHQCSHRRYS